MNLFNSESMQINGLRVIGDQGALTWAHIRATPMRVTKMWAQAVDGCYPIRSKKAAMIKVRFFKYFTIFTVLFSICF
jgi:hypothetical protein